MATGSPMVQRRRLGVEADSLYRFADPDDPDIVVLETLTSDLHLSDDEDVSRYRLLFGWLAPAALSPEESVTFLAGLARQL